MTGGRCVPRRIWGSQLSSQADCVLLWEPGQVLGLAGSSPSCFPITLDPGGCGEQSLEQKRKSGGGGVCVCTPSTPARLYCYNRDTFLRQLAQLLPPWPPNCDCPIQAVPSVRRLNLYA